MEQATEKDIKRYMAILGEIIGRCQNLVHQRSIQEADLRKGLSLLKLAHSEAERGLLGVEIEEWQWLRTETITTVAILLRSLRGFNLDLTTWEPSIRTTRGRVVRGRLWLKADQ